MAFLSLFNENHYLNLYADIKAAVGAGGLTAREHFVQYGLNEGRTPLMFFQEKFYLAHNPDVEIALAEGGMTAAIQHLITHGHSEERSITPAVNLKTYLLANPDVAIAVADGQTTALDHLAYYGLAEGRDMGNGIVLSMFHHDPIFMKALENKDYDAALARLDAVVPFISSFVPPAGWVPDPDMPIPVDFVPPPGMKLQVPPGIRIPVGVILPETFLPVRPEPEPVPEPPYTPDPSPGDGGVPPEPEPGFTVTVDDEGWLVVGKDHGAVTVTLSDDETRLVFTPQHDDAVFMPRPDGSDGGKLVVDGELIASSETLSGYVIKGDGGVKITGSDNSQTISVQTTGENSIHAGKGGDIIELGAGRDIIAIEGGTPETPATPPKAFFNISDINSIAAGDKNITFSLFFTLDGEHSYSYSTSALPTTSIPANTHEILNTIKTRISGMFNQAKKNHQLDIIDAENSEDTPTIVFSDNDGSVIYEAHLTISFSDINTSDFVIVEDRHPTIITGTPATQASASDSFFLGPDDDNIDTIRNFDISMDKLSLPKIDIANSDELQADSDIEGLVILGVDHGIVSFSTLDNRELADFTAWELTSAVLQAAGENKVTAAVQHGEDTLVIQTDGVAGAHVSDIVVKLQGVQVTDLNDILVSS